MACILLSERTAMHARLPIGNLRVIAFGARNSESNSQAEFNLAPAIRLHAVDLPESSMTQIRVWVREMRCIRKVVGLNAELPLHLLSKGEILELRQVHV